MHPFSCAAMALEVFRERGLLEIEYEGDECILRRCPIAGKADLNASFYMQTLREIAQSKR